MITREFDTIVAISTPLGEGAIGIVRLSGTDSFAIAQKILKERLEQGCKPYPSTTVTLLTRRQGRSWTKLVVGAMKFQRPSLVRYYRD